MTISFNYQNNEIVSSPTVIVSGSSSKNIQRGIVGFTNNENKVFPPQYFEVNNGHFKAIVHVSPNEVNRFKVEIMEGDLISALGFPEFKHGKPNIVDTASLDLQFYPLPQNKPVHLCIIRARDSPNVYDMPSYRLNRGERPTLENAINKLKVAGRLMQAYTQDEMRAVGFSNRSFQFVEETKHDQTIFGYKVQSPTPHQEVKIHVLTSPKTVAELRSPDLAQQNPHAKDSGGLFSHAIDLVKKTPEIFDRASGTAVQCAVMYLDSTYDKSKNLILTHAALGGGGSDVKMAIFGSHGLHSYPQNFPLVTPSFLDTTRLTTNEVANDCNECGTSWECLNICLGAFMHEIGHSLGCPHQVDGVMLRDYQRFNRSFMTREFECLRTHSRGEEIGFNGLWSSACHWNKLDLIRFLYHDSFSLPVDQFEKVYATTRKPDSSYYNNSAPSVYGLSQDNSIVKSECGIYLMELIDKDLARSHIAFLPRSYGGPNVQHELKLDYRDLLKKLRDAKGDASDQFKIRVLSLGGDLFIDDFKKHCSQQQQELIKNNFGLGKGQLVGAKSALLGKASGEMHITEFFLPSVYKVRIYSGAALDGVKFYCKTRIDQTPTAAAPRGGGGGGEGAPPIVPNRNYLHKLFKKHGKEEHSMKEKTQNSDDVTALVGKETNSYAEFSLQGNEQIVKFNVRNGAWVDAIQFVTNQNRTSPMFGNANGGHMSSLEAPTSDTQIVGMYFYMGSWIDGLGIVYSKM
ncbi:hypothetical protein KGF56_001643 [Candida oxycetoniae]|uniref:Jacalin-type lectin domain-containing protein n=1 Tax=Candida oxycetoniae TaxID=497107 RepID=A0AAI9T090_9ASCO|nr:uncharacterized protein KGF56_001643 [Candida oxycetoniae]KAI3405625.2 hypothetical protein KGF56_001643 [Candida oxycetoniae]